MFPMIFGHYIHNRQFKPFQGQDTNTLIVGASRTGKSTLQVRLVLDEIYDNQSVTFIDDGQSIDEVLEYVPKHRQKDVILFDPLNHPFAFNLLSDVPGDQHDLYTSAILEAVKSVWGYNEIPTPVLDLYLRATLHTCLTVHGTTLLSLKFLLTDEKYRESLLKQTDDFIIHNFWSDYETLKDRDKRQETSSTLNKLWAILFSPKVRYCLDQKDNKLVFKDKIVLIALRTALGHENQKLLGALALCNLFIQQPTTRLFIDGDFTAGLRNILNVPTIRTVVSLQTPDIDAGQIVAFRTSYAVAATLEPEFNLNRDHFGLAELSPYKAYVCFEGKTSTIQSFRHGYAPTHQADKIKRRCTSQYTMPIEAVEKRLRRFDASPR